MALPIARPSVRIVSHRVRSLLAPLTQSLPRSAILTTPHALQHSALLIRTSRKC
ncbi:hypothetical protein BDV93DRAFT_528212 [Ceratobasidium sp. AG-I]|nr:hypothetical protein BDV93DRAFT_528212 [Ceratobasidium sp. AG-I]